MRHIILNFETLGCTETQPACLVRTPKMCYDVDTIRILRSRFGDN